MYSGSFFRKNDLLFQKLKSISDYYSLVSTYNNMASYKIPSVCILRAFSTATEQTVRETFQQLFGEHAIAEVAMVEREDRNTGEAFWLIFVHFNAVLESNYPDIEAAKGFGERLVAGGEVRVEYRAPWYWKVRQYVPKPRTAPRIILGISKPVPESVVSEVAESLAVAMTAEASVTDSTPTTHGGEVAESQAN